MITFLPSKVFTICAKALDDRRLLSQVGEARIILEAILANEQVGQPAFDMWRRYPGHLAIYGKIMSDERHIRFGTRTETFFVQHIPDWFYGVETWDLSRDPAWLGDRRLHLSHIRALYHKDPEHYAKWRPVLQLSPTYCCVGCNYWWPTHVGVK